MIYWSICWDFLKLGFSKFGVFVLNLYVELFLGMLIFKWVVCNNEHFSFVMCFVTDCQRGSLLVSKTWGTKCIWTPMCNVLANHYKKLETRFRLFKVCLCVKLELSDWKIYWTKFARLNRSKIRLDRLNLMQIVFSAEFPTQPKPIWRVGFYVLLQV